MICQYRLILSNIYATLIEDVDNGVHDSWVWIRDILDSASLGQLCYEPKIVLKLNVYGEMFSGD